MTRAILFIGFFLLSFAKSHSQNEFRIGIEPRDKYSQGIVPAIISIRALDSETELPGQLENEQYVISVSADKQYQIIVATQDYKTYRETITFERKGTSNTPQIFIVAMDPINPPKALGPKMAKSNDPTITIIDKKTRMVVQQATMNVKTIDGASVVSVKNMQGIWAAKLQEYESYVVEVKAAGYEQAKEVIKYKLNEPIEISMLRSAKQSLEFQAVDALSNRPIGARFKLTDNIRETYTGNTTVSNDIFGVELPLQPDPYYLTVSASGYRPYQVTISLNSELPVSQQKQIIKLVKSEATLKLKVVDSQTSQTVGSSSLKVMEQGSNREILNLASSKGDISAVINPDRKYIIEAEADGYSPYKQIFEAKSFNNELNFAVKLTKMLDSYMILSARDAVTNKIIPATFKIISTQTDQDFEFRTTQVSPTGKLTITEPAVYRIETTIPGYRANKGELNAIEMTLGKVFKYEAVVFSENAKMPEPVVAVTKPVEAPKPKPEPVKAAPVVVAKAPEPAPKVVETPKVETPKSEPVKTAAVVVAKAPEAPKPQPVVVATPKPEVAAVKKTAPIAEPVKPKVVDSPKPEPTVAKIIETPKKAAPVVVAAAPKPEVKAAPVKLVVVSKVYRFRIVDGQTKKAIMPSRFAIRSQKSQQLTPAVFTNGIFQAELLFEDDYYVEIEANGYTKVIGQIDAGEMARQQVFDKDFPMLLIPKKAAVAATAKAAPASDKGFENFKIGQTLTFEDNVYFDQGEYTLRFEAQFQLDKLAAIMNKNSKLKVEIAGHTDNVGDPKQNMTLSEFRAKVIANHLINRGIAEERITYTGYGQTKPKTVNDNEDSKRRNRRVEFIIREN